jgi:hypothetical protein
MSPIRSRCLSRSRLSWALIWSYDCPEGVAGTTGIRARTESVDAVGTGGEAGTGALATIGSAERATVTAGVAGARICAGGVGCATDGGDGVGCATGGCGGVLSGVDGVADARSSLLTADLALVSTRTAARATAGLGAGVAGAGLGGVTACGAGEGACAFLGRRCTRRAAARAS